MITFNIEHGLVLVLPLRFVSVHNADSLRQVVSGKCGHNVSLFDSCEKCEPSLAPCGCPEFTDCEHVTKVSPSELAAAENKRPVKPASLFTSPVNSGGRK